MNWWSYVILIMAVWFFWDTVEWTVTQVDYNNNNNNNKIIISKFIKRHVCLQKAAEALWGMFSRFDNTRTWKASNQTDGLIPRHGRTQQKQNVAKAAARGRFRVQMYRGPRKILDTTWPRPYQYGPIAPYEVIKDVSLSTAAWTERHYVIDITILYGRKYFYVHHR